jgi:hypothetical protein
MNQEQLKEIIKTATERFNENPRNKPQTLACSTF